ncbi:MAG: NUDIX domain-containing protein [Gemmobacter sp.]
MAPPPRIAARAIILHEGRLLLVNAWPGGRSDLWCAPGGGVERGQSLPETLMREVAEETGLRIAVEEPALVNEFHDPARGFHQIEVFFRARITGEGLDPGWRDPAGVVTERRFFARAEMETIRFKPDLLPAAAWGTGCLYDPLEPILR